MSKVAKYLEYVLLAICVVILVAFYVQSASGVFKLSNLAEVLESTTMTDGILWWTYALTALAIGLILVLAVVAMCDNTKSLKKAGLLLVITVVLVAASYLLASGAPVEVNVANQPTEATFKMTDMILNLTYFLMGGVVLALVGGGIYNAVKK